MTCLSDLVGKTVADVVGVIVGLKSTDSCRTMIGLCDGTQPQLETPTCFMTWGDDGDLAAAYYDNGVVRVRS